MDRLTRSNWKVPLVIVERDETTVQRGYTSQSYIQALDEVLLPYYYPGECFMQDNARVHTSRMTEHLERHGIWVIEHLPYSPDLNPIEHMCWALKKAIHKTYPDFSTIGEAQEDWNLFCEALKEVWLTIPDPLIRKLIYSMPRRLAAVEKAHGYQTKH